MSERQSVAWYVITCTSYLLNRVSVADAAQHGVNSGSNLHRSRVDNARVAGCRDWRLGNTRAHFFRASAAGYNTSRFGLNICGCSAWGINCTWLAPLALARTC